MARVEAEINGSRAKSACKKLVIGGIAPEDRGLPSFKQAKDGTREPCFILDIRGGILIYTTRKVHDTRHPTGDGHFEIATLEIHKKNYLHGKEGKLRKIFTFFKKILRPRSSELSPVRR